jgi:predicted Zn-dependent protease
VPLVQEALREAGHEQLLVDGEIRIEFEKTIPIDWVELSKIATAAVFTLATLIAVENYKTFVIPAIKKRFKVKATKRRKKKR